jgi:hypothetical protein
MERGTLESTKWIDEVAYQRYLRGPLQKIYDFMMYRKIIKTCSDETIYKMSLLIEKHGMTIGIKMTIGEIRVWRSQQRYEKKHYINNLINTPTVTVESFKDQIEEEDRISDLTDKQRRLRNIKYPEKGGVPKTIFIEQPIIDSFDDNGVGYKVFEKIYCYYSAIIYSPIEEVLVKDSDWKKQWALEYKIENVLRGVKERYRDYNLNKNVQTTSITITNNKRNTSNYTPNIDKIKRNLGLTEQDENLNGDIF